MKTSGPIVGMVLALAAPQLSPAAEPFVGARLGFALPYGDIALGRSIRNVVESDVPLQVDAGFRFGRQWVLGAYGSYAPAQLAGESDRACGAADCSANVVRAGVQGAFHSQIEPQREAWVGALAGWERLTFDAPGSLELTANGVELGLQGGYDFARGSSALGPFTMLTFGRYWSVSGTGVSFEDMKTHVALQLGVRGYLRL